jgi:cytochrome c oxidase subunit 4
MLKSDHMVGVGTYLAIFTLLMVMTTITTAVAYVDLGAMNVLIMLAIAVTKATLVLLWFMHLKFTSRLTWLWAAGSFVFLAILFAITLSDYLTRGFMMAPIPS